MSTPSVSIATNPEETGVSNPVQQSVSPTENEDSSLQQMSPSQDCSQNLLSLFTTENYEGSCPFIQDLANDLKGSTQKNTRVQCDQARVKLEGVLSEVCKLKDSAQVQLNDLPNELLIEVLGYLSPTDLLRSARMVCIRWRELALHHGVWAHCSFSYFYAEDRYDWRCLKLALRLAPCLSRLELPGIPHIRSGTNANEEVREHRLVDALLSSGPCAVSRLGLTLRSSMDAPPATAVLKHQSSLGRLRSVHILISDKSVQSLKVVHSLQCLDLDEMSIQNASQKPLAARPDPSKNHPLKRLRYKTTVAIRPAHCLALGPHGVQQYLPVLQPEVTHRVEPLLIQLLTKHASTLEVVSLMGLKHDEVFPLLATCLNLREAWVPAEPGIVSLLHCPRLSTLCLQIPHLADDDLPAGVIPFLSDATNLTALTLLFSEKQAKPFPLQDVFAALASSGDSRLAVLTIGELAASREVGRRSEPTDGVGSLPPHLSALPLLHTIVVVDHLFDAAFLGAISPDSAPALRVLRTRYARVCCPTAVRECYLTVVQDAIRRNPLLHFEGLNAEHACDMWGHCVCCSAALHPKGMDSCTDDPSSTTPWKDYASSMHRKGNGLTSRPNLCPQEQTTLPWLPRTSDSGVCRFEALRMPKVFTGFYGHGSSERCNIHRPSVNWVHINVTEES